MKRITQNAIVDIGCPLYVFLPEGSGKSASYLGIIQNQWIIMHNYTSLAFAALLILHLLLHVKFFRNIGNYIMTGNKKSSDT